MTDSEKLILIAKWFDMQDAKKGIKNNEVQRTLRRIAERLIKLDMA